MKKITLALAFVLIFGGMTVTTYASSCGLQDDGSIVYCGNGPIVPQQPGGRFLKAGEEDCPAWFPSLFGHACYTMRAFGIPFN